MRPVVLGLLVVFGVACSGGGGATPLNTSTTQPDASENSRTASSSAPASTSPPEQQPGDLPPEALDELGPTEAPESGGESVGPLGGTELTLQTDDGSIQIGGGVVPASADDFPLPDDYELELASETSGATGFSGFSQLSVEALADFFRASLPAAGYEIVDDNAPTASVVLIGFQGPDTEGDLALSEKPGGPGTTIIVTLSPVS